MDSKDYRKILQLNLENRVKVPVSGDVVKVSQVIKEKDKERTQIFEGLVISVKKSNSFECTFTVRKESNGVGVERIFPLYSPIIKKIEVVSKIHRKQSKLYYLRETKKRLRNIGKEKEEENDGYGVSETENDKSKEMSNLNKNKLDKGGVSKKKEQVKVLKKKKEVKKK